MYREIVITTETKHIAFLVTEGTINLGTVHEIDKNETQIKNINKTQVHYCNL